MEFQTSDLIAMCSLIIALLAYRHTVKSSQSTSSQIQKTSERYFNLSSNIALAEASKKYVLLLSDVSREFEEITRELSYPALVASRNIGASFDMYDKKISDHPYLRHCFNNAITIVREAYDYELTYQTGLNITDRIRSLKYIKDDIYQNNKLEQKNSIFSFFKKECSSQTPEEKISSSTLFWDSVKEIYARISSEDEHKVFKETLKHLSQYRKLHENKRERLNELEKKLESAIKENALEMFDIQDIPNLGPKLYRVKSDICRYKELYFPDFHGIESTPISDGIAYSIYSGSIVLIASQHFMWGTISQQHPL